MPQLARVGDLFTTPGKPPLATVGPGSVDVLVGGRPALRAGDVCSVAAVAGGNPVVVIAGSSSVLIGGKPAARSNDPTSTGGVLVASQQSVLVG